MSYINLLNKQLETINYWFLSRRGGVNFRIHYLDNNLFFNTDKLKNDLTTIPIFNKIELDEIFNRTYRLNIDIDDYYKEPKKDKKNVCFFQIENEIFTLHCVPSTYGELSISKQYYDSNINIVSTIDLRDLTIKLNEINNIIYKAFPDHYKDKFNLLETMQNNRLNLKLLFSNNFTISIDRFEEVYKFHLENFKSKYNINNVFTELEYKDYLIDYLVYSINYDVLDNSKKQFITKFYEFLLKKVITYELKDHYKRYLLDKKFYCFMFNTTYYTNRENGNKLNLKNVFACKTTSKDFFEKLETCKERFNYIYEKLDNFDKIDLKTNTLQHLNELKDKQNENILINHINNLINTIENNSNPDPQQSETIPSKELKDFFININEFDNFLNELKTNFKTEIGLDIKAIINICINENILVIGTREFKKFYNLLKVNFNRDIGTYTSINDKEPDATKIGLVLIKLKPLIIKYKTT